MSMNNTGTTPGGPQGCRVCGRALSADEVGLSKKTINRNVTEFMCIKCLAEYFNTSEESLKAYANRLRLSGCAFFPSEPDR